MVGQSYFLDRVQTGGISSFNQPKERVNELGDPLTVGIVRDIPDLTFDVETLDVTPELEALINGQDPTTITNGTLLDPNNSMSLDIIMPIRQTLNSTTMVEGLIVPCLALDTLSYKFAVKANATKTATFRGDSAFYTVGTPKFQRFAVSGTGPYNFASTAAPYVDPEQGTRFALNVMLRNPTTFQEKRLFVGANYTETNGHVTLLQNPATFGTFTFVDICYSTLVNVTQTVALQPSPAGSPPTGKPAAVRSKDMDVYISNNSATPTYFRLDGIQSFDASRKVTLEPDEEFGNPNYVSQDYQTPAVTGNLAFKPVDANDLYATVGSLLGVPSGQVIGAFSDIPIAIDVRISDPVTGARLQTVHVPDARFTAPGLTTRVAQKSVVSLAWESDSGVITSYKGSGPFG